MAQHRTILVVAYLATLLPLLGLALLPLNRSGEPATTLSLAARWANRAALAAGVLVFFPVTFTSTCT